MGPPVPVAAVVGLSLELCEVIIPPSLAERAWFFPRGSFFYGFVVRFHQLPGELLYLCGCWTFCVDELGKEYLYARIQLFPVRLPVVERGLWSPVCGVVGPQAKGYFDGVVVRSVVIIPCHPALPEGLFSFAVAPN